MKRKLVLLQVFIAIVMVCTSVYATLDTTIGVTVSSSTVYKGDEVEVTLALKDVDSNKKIINVEGYINYNKDLFEKVTYDSVVKDSDNKVKIGNEMLPVEKASELSGSGSFVSFNDEPTTDNDIKILIDCQKGISKNSDLLTIKFKLKSDAKTGDIENAITYSEFVAKSEDDSSNGVTEKINLTVKAKSEAPKEDDKKNESKNENKKAEDNKNDAVGAANDKNKNQNKNTNSNTNKNVNKNNTNTNTNNTNTDDSVSGKKLPAAGAKVLVVPAIVLIAIAYITYNRYIRMRGI